jgi:hypothetical protein
MSKDMYDPKSRVVFFNGPKPVQASRVLKQADEIKAKNAQRLAQRTPSSRPQERK